jgi:hypothetical protein
MIRMKMPLYLFIISLALSLGCTKQTSSPTALPGVTWGAEQLAVGFDSNSLLTVVGENVKLVPNIIKGQPVRFSTSPDLPIGLVLNQTTGVISGTVALAQPKTRYSLNSFDLTGRGSSVSFYIETRKDIFVIDQSVPEVTTVSGRIVDLSQLLSGGKGGYRFLPIPSNLGSVSVDGIYTPGAVVGPVEFIATDNLGAGSKVSFKVYVGVPRLSVAFTDPIEGNDARIELTLSGKSSSSTSVSYSVSLNSAMADSVATDPGTVTFAPGETKKTIAVKTFNNHVYKDNGRFDVTLVLDSGLKFEGSDVNTKVLALTLININPAPLVSFEVASSQVIEFDTDVTFNIKLDRASAKETRVSYSLDKLSSTIQAFDSDFTDGFVVFAARTSTNPGETLKTIRFKVRHDVNGNQVASPDRLMTIVLKEPVSSTLGQIIRHNITITDPMVIELNSETTDFVLLEALQRKGWNGSQNVLVRIADTAVLRSSSSGRGAFSSGFVNVNYPTKVTLVNKGTIVGHGGAPGLAADPTAFQYNNYCNQQISGNSGGAGGPAISTVIPMYLANEGNIFGGAGGGGGGISAVMGSDANCNTKYKLFGGSGGQGADFGAQSYSAPENGVSPVAQATWQPYLSPGGTGGVPGESGVPGSLPANQLTADATPGAGGPPGPAIIDIGPNNIKLVTFYKTCKFSSSSFNRIEYNVVPTCQQKYQEMVAGGLIQSGLTVSDITLGKIKGATQ